MTLTLNFVIFINLVGSKLFIYLLEYAPIWLAHHKERKKNFRGPPTSPTMEVIIYLWGNL